MKRLLIKEVDPNGECPYMEKRPTATENSGGWTEDGCGRLCTYVKSFFKYDKDGLRTSPKCNDKNCPLPKINPNYHEDI